jgi:hypothetical protein
LPKADNSDKVLAFKKPEEDPNQDLYTVVQSLRGLSTHEVKQWVLEDPDLTADVVMALYEKNTMPYESIIFQIKDDKAVDGIVDIIRHIVSFNSTPKTNRN